MTVRENLESSGCGRRFPLFAENQHQFATNGYDHLKMTDLDPWRNGIWRLVTSLPCALEPLRLLTQDRFRKVNNS